MVTLIGVILSVVSFVAGFFAVLYPEEFITWQQKGRHFDKFEKTEKGIRNMRFRGMLIILCAIAILVIVFAY